MTDPAADDPSASPPIAAAAPAITASAPCVIIGDGFLPDQEITLCIDYIADGVSDYLTYTTDSGGRLHAELPLSPTTGPIHVAATDQRTDSNGAPGLLWSNTHVVRL
jgi:hypothetical protein